MILSATPSEPLGLDFPILERQVSGKDLVYLDSAATTQKPRCVLNRMEGYYESYNANVHRALHTLANEATTAYEAARDRVAAFFNAWDRRGVIFTRNFTEAANLVSYVWARDQLGPYDEILCTVAEHHSNLVPWQLAAEATGASVRYLEVTPDGNLDLHDLERRLSHRTRLVTVSAMSNVLGTRFELRPLIEAAHALGAKVFVDAAQRAAHGPLDVQALGADFVGVTAHKMLGPTGIGALIARPEELEHAPPFMGGGEMITDVTLHRSHYNVLPWRFEAGTPMIAEAVGWHAALDYLERVGMDAVEAHLDRLTAYGLEQLLAVPGLSLVGPRDPRRRGPIFAFNLHDEDRLLHPADVGLVLDKLGIAVRVGHHCAQPLHDRLGLPGTVRASAYLYTNPADLDRLVEGLEQARALLA